MKLYYSKGACSLAPRIIINEIGLPCEYEAVDLKEKRTESGADFLSVNPKGAVPTLLTNANEVLTENAVILQYLAEESKTTRLLPSQGSIKYYRILEWLNFIATDLHKNIGVFFNAAIPQEVKENVFLKLVLKKLTYVDTHLKNKFLCGNDFTLPDAYLFVMLMWAAHFKFDLSALKNLQRYFGELKQHKSIVKSLEEENIHLK